MMLYLFFKVMWVLFVAIGWICYWLAMLTFWLIKGMVLLIPLVIVAIVNASRRNQVAVR